MLKMKDINEAVDYLLQAEVLTSDGKDLYIYKNEKIHCFIAIHAEPAYGGGYSYLYSASGIKQR